MVATPARGEAHFMKLGATVEITDQAIAALEVGILWDAQVRGFFARRRVLGGPVRYGVKYRFGRRQVWLTFTGSHGSPWSAERARKQALRKIGTDPGERDERRGVPTFAAFAARYIRDHIEVRTKPATREKMIPRVENKLVPRFGKKRLDEIRSSDVQAWHASMAATPVEANRCLAMLKHMFTAAEQWQQVHWAKPAGGYNPCRGVKKYPETPRRVFLAAPQLARLGAALRKMETTGLPGRRYDAVLPNPGAANLFRLALLTGARPGALKGLKHEWVDAKEGVIRIPDGKTGFQAIVMPPAARQLYSKLPKIANCEWVFPVRGLNHIQNIWDAWWRLRAEAKLGDVKPHDLRHTFASVAVAGKESLYMVQVLLGHSSPQTTQRYAHMSMDPQQEATERIAGTIKASLDGKKAKPSARPKKSA